MSRGSRPSGFGTLLALGFAGVVLLAAGLAGCSALGGGVMSASEPQAAAPSSNAATATPAAPASVAKTGDRVAAPWNGDMYVGSVTAVGGESADVLYDEDNVNREVPLAQLVVIVPKEWKAGDKVNAVWTAGRFYEGSIVGLKAPGVYTVKWEDDTLSDVEAAKIYAR